MLQQSNKLNVLRNSVELLTDDVTALYCRFSQDDKQEGDINCIVNQKKILKKYALDHGYSNYLYYIDDGF